MKPYLGFFFITLTGIFSSTLVKMFHFPWVAALVIGGMILGPHSLNILQPDSTLDFIGQLGLIFLMFMAGLDTKLSNANKTRIDLFLLAFINGVVPFAVGFLISHFFGFGLISSLIIGTVFISSSVAVVIPTLEANNILNIKIGNYVLITTFIQDISSLILMSLILQKQNPVSNLPLYVFYPLLILFLYVFRLVLPKVKEFSRKITKSKDIFQQDLRTIFLIMLGTVIIFELLGLHSIIAGFFSGFLLADSFEDPVLKGKLKAISYGFFIPAFFVLVGVNTYIHGLFVDDIVLPLTLAIVFGSMFSKLMSGTLGAKILGFNWNQSLFFGATSIPQLSTTLAVAYTATNLGLIPEEVNTALVTLSIVSVIIASFLISQFKNLNPETTK